MHKADNVPPYRAVVMKSGSLNFLEPSGPAQACYGRTLPFLHDITSQKMVILSLGFVFQLGMEFIYWYYIQYAILFVLLHLMFL